MDSLDFGILGPLEVRRDGRPVPITAPRQRAVLAVLLLEANRMVTVDRLIDHLWTTPPPTARNTVQSLVLRLRRRLQGDAPRSALLTRGPGYLLQVDRGRLDVHRFDDFLRRGRAALATGNAVDAAQWFGAAGAVARGPVPLADVTVDGVPLPGVRRLEESCLEAIEGRLSAGLLLGRHAELVGELRALVAEHPLRECLHGQLILALHRCGRQAEALQAFRDLRRLLVDTLGIEPGAGLQALHQAILAGKAAQEPLRCTGTGR